MKMIKMILLSRGMASVLIGLIAIELSGCCALTCALNPQCNPPPFFKCPEAPKYSTLPSIPDSVSFESDPQVDATETYDNPAIPSLHAGVGPSFFSGDRGENEKNRPLIGFELGANWNLPINDQLQFLPGIQFRTLGNLSIEETEVNDIYYYHVYRFEEITKLNYIDLQPFLSYNITPQFVIMGGPSFSYLIGANRSYKSEHSSRSERTTEGLSRWNIGGTMQAFYQPENSFFGIGLNYSHGFLNINQEHEYTPGGNERKYSNSIAVVVVYKLPQGYSNYKIRSARSSSPEETRRRDAERKRKYEEQRRNPKSNSKRL